MRCLMGILAVVSAALAAQARPGPVVGSPRPTGREADLSGPAASTVLAIRDVTLIDGNGGPPVPGSCVVVRDGRIAAVGAAGRVKTPPGARVLRPPAGTTLLPGFIDMHVHASVQPGLMPYFLANGVTSVRDLGCADARVAELKRYRQEAVAGKQIGPRLFLAGSPVDGVPRAAHWFPGPGARDGEEATTAVANLADQGVDVIKLYRRLSAPAAASAIREAHRRGLPVTWDYQWSYGYLSNAIRSGVDGLEYVYYSERTSATEYEQLAEAIGATGLWLDPTLVAFRPPDDDVTADRDFQQLPPSLPRFWKKLFWPMETDSEFAMMKGFIRRVHRQGGKLLVGTDSPVKYVAPGYAFHREMQLLSECGLSPSEVLKAATSQAASALRRDRDLGSVEVGKLADLVLVSGDPTKDLRRTRNVRWVILNGRMHNPDRVLAHAKEHAPAVDVMLPPYAHGD